MDASGTTNRRAASSHNVMEVGPARAANGIQRAAVIPAIAKSVKSRSPSSRLNVGLLCAAAIPEASPTAVFIFVADSPYPRGNRESPGIVALDFIGNEPPVGKKKQCDL